MFLEPNSCSENNPKQFQNLTLPKFVIATLKYSKTILKLVFTNFLHRFFENIQRLFRLQNCLSRRTAINSSNQHSAINSSNQHSAINSSNQQQQPATTINSSNQGSSQQQQSAATTSSSNQHSSNNQHSRSHQQPSDRHLHDSVSYHYGS